MNKKRALKRIEAEEMQEMNNTVRTLTLEEFETEVHSLDEFSTESDGEAVLIKYKEDVVYEIPLLRFNQAICRERYWVTIPRVERGVVGALIDRFRKTPLHERDIHQPSFLPDPPQPHDIEIH